MSSWPENVFKMVKVAQKHRTKVQKAKGQPF